MKADSFLTYDPSFPYSDTTLQESFLPRWLHSWANFDGVHYIRLVEHGYHGDAYIQAFFPLYPMLVATVTFFTQNILLSGLIVSNLAFLLLLVIWHRFTSKRFGKQVGWYSLLTLLLFPTSFFFGAVYTESLFFLFVLLSFIKTEEKQYSQAALCIAAASAVRVVGILLVPVLILHILFEHYDLAHVLKNWIFHQKISFKEQFNTLTDQAKSIEKKYKQIGILSLGSLGLLLYMLYLYTEFGDPVLFFSVQSDFGGIRDDSLVLYPQVVYRYVQILLTARPFDFKYFSYVLEFIVSTVGFVGLLYGFIKMRFTYILFALGAFFVPTLTGTFSSMPRYILVCFPLFILVAQWAAQSKLFRYTWFTVSGFLLVLLTTLYIQGYWVA